MRKDTGLTWYTGHFTPTELQVYTDMEGEFVHREIGPGVFISWKLMNSGQVVLFGLHSQ